MNPFFFLKNLFEHILTNYFPLKIKIKEDFCILIFFTWQILFFYTLSNWPLLNEFAVYNAFTISYAVVDMECIQCPLFMDTLISGEMFLFLSWIMSHEICFLGVKDASITKSFLYTKKNDQIHNLYQALFLYVEFYSEVSLFHPNLRN